MDNKFVRIDRPDDPDRCQAVNKNTQCPFKKITGSNYCPMHGGSTAIHAQKLERERMYRLSKWQARHDNFVDDDKIKSLREEIGILRILMEETVNLCKDSNDLLMYSSKISDLAIKLEKLVSSCHRLEASTGMLLDKQGALHLASVIVKIIGDYVTDEDAIDKISQDIMLAIAHSKPEAKEPK